MMKKTWILAIALAAATAVPAQAEILYRGTLKFTKVNAACTQGPGAGEYYTSQYHPSVAPGNNNFSALNRFFDYGATSYALDSGGFSSSFQKVSNVSIGWSNYTPAKPSYLLVSKTSPKTIKKTTEAVTLVGQIKNPYGDAGQENCVADFIFSGLQQIQ